MKYSIIIATYNRPDAVITAIRCAINQTVKPEQIIIVDATPDFDKQKSSVSESIEIPDDISFIYEKAIMASSANQRNQAIELLSENIEVVFFIDDDSFMYEDCAEKILSVYESDVSNEIAGVQGGLANIAPSAQDKETQTIKKKKKGTDTSSSSILNKNFSFLWKHILLMNSEMLFIPYFGDYKVLPFSASVPKSVFTKTLFHGCRMSFRKSVLQKEQFDRDLVRYSAGEDLDLSYRASSYGVLLEYPDALIYHHSADAGRLSRFNSSKMGAYNVALYVHKNTNNRVRDYNRYKLLFIRRLLAEFLKDLMTKRLSFPQLRGVWTGGIMGLKLLAKSEIDRQLIEENRKEFM